MTDDKEWRAGLQAALETLDRQGRSVNWLTAKMIFDGARKALAELESKDKEIEQPMSSPNKPEPPPRPGAGVAIWDLVINDMRERDEIGAAKYGRRLRAGDGRNSLVDAYQEALDLAVYLRKRIEEENKPEAEIAKRGESECAWFTCGCGHDDPPCTGEPKPEPSGCGCVGCVGDYEDEE